MLRVCPHSIHTHTCYSRWCWGWGTASWRSAWACDDDHLTPLLHVNQQVYTAYGSSYGSDRCGPDTLPQTPSPHCLLPATHTHTRHEWWSYLRTDLKWFCHSLWFYQPAASRWLQSTDLSVLDPDWIKERGRNDHQPLKPVNLFDFY